VYYRVDDDTWETVVRRQIASLASFGRITRDGMALVGASSARAARIRAAYEIFAWLEQAFAAAPPLPSASRATPDPTHPDPTDPAR